MATHRRHSLEFKRQVVQEFTAGETLHGLAKRHDLSRNLIRIWVRKYEEGALDDEAQAADLIQAYEARIAALQRLVGQQALELEFLKGALRKAPQPRTGPTSVVTSPTACAVAKGCRLMGLVHSTYYDRPTRTVDDTALVEALFGVCDEFEAMAIVASARPYGSRA
jgi:transposase